MKKIITLLLTIIAIQARPQSYQKMLADSITHFHVVPLVIPVRMAQSTNCVNAWIGDYYAQGDSVYNGYTYKKVSYNGFAGLMREDTSAKKVYFIQYCNTTEDLLYDFSLSNGGTISYSFPNNSSFNGTFTVDSIKLKHDYLNLYRKHFYLRNHAISGNSTLEMIEGVGNVNTPLFLYYGFIMGILSFDPNAQYCPGAAFDAVLSCKWNNGTKVYYDSCTYALALNNNCVGVSDTCQYQTICSGIEEFTGVKNISVYPNPANDLVTIEIEAEKQMNFSFTVINILGLEVKNEIRNQLVKGKNTLRLPVKDLPEGIYLLKFFNEERSLNKTILVDR